VSTSAFRGCHLVSVTDSYGRILGFLYWGPLERDNINESLPSSYGYEQTIVAVKVPGRYSSVAASAVTLKFWYRLYL
jgi:hypothetical protein